MNTRTRLTDLRNRFHGVADRYRDIRSDCYGRMRLIQHVAVHDPFAPLRIIEIGLPALLSAWKVRVTADLTDQASAGPIEAHLFDEVRAKSQEIAEDLLACAERAFHGVDNDPRIAGFRPLLKKSLGEAYERVARVAEELIALAHTELRQGLIPSLDTSPLLRPAENDDPVDGFAMISRP